MINVFDVESHIFGMLEVKQRYLFFLICLFADDDGIFPVQFVPNRCFPYDQLTIDDVIDDLRELEQKNYIAMYGDGGPDNEMFLQVVDWWFRQRIDKKIYYETTFLRPPWYRSRPNDIKKFTKSSEDIEPIMDDLAIIEKSSTDKTSKDEIRKDKTRIGENMVEEILRKETQDKKKQAILDKFPLENPHVR